MQHTHEQWHANTKSSDTKLSLQETSAILLGWCSAMLAAEHQVQAAAAAEVAAVIGTRSPCAADVRWASRTLCTSL